MKLDTVFNGISAASALAIALLAAWAVFWTDLPEVLVRQLRSDIASTQEELSELRRQKLSLDNRAGELNTELRIAVSELESVRGEVGSLEAERNRLHGQIRKIEAQRRKYFKYTKDRVIEAFFGAIESRINYLRKDAGLLRTFSSFEEWVLSEPVAITFAGFVTKSAINRHRAWVREQPATWQSESELRKFAEFDLGDSFFAQVWARQKGKPYRTVEDVLGRKPRAKTYVEVAEEFRKEITAKRRDKIETGRKIIESALGHETLNLLLVDDKARLIRIIEAVVEESPKIMSAQLEIRLPEGWTQEDLLTKVRRAEGALAEFERAIDPLRNLLQQEF